LDLLVQTQSKAVISNIKNTLGTILKKMINIVVTMIITVMVSDIVILTLGLMDNVKELQDLQKIKITIMTKLSPIFDVNMNKNIETIIVMVKEHAHNLTGAKALRDDII
jgi:hypothetical protein